MGTLQLDAQDGILAAVLHTRDALNYSLMHNRVPLLSAATVTHHGSQTSQPLQLSLALEPLGPNLDLASSPLQISVPALEPGEVYSVPASDLAWPLRAEALGCASASSSAHRGCAGLPPESRPVRPAEVCPCHYPAWP